MKATKRYLSTSYFKKDLNVLIRFAKLKNLKVYRISKFCIEFRNSHDNFRFTYDFHKERTEIEHWNDKLYDKHEMRRLFVSNNTCRFLLSLKNYDHQAYK